MALAEDIERVVSSVERLSTNGVPIKIEHEVETASLWQLVVGLAMVAVLAVALLGVKDVIVHNVTKGG